MLWPVIDSPLALVSSIEDHIHVHVKKLYPDAELPSFKILEKDGNWLKMRYISSRGLYTLAKGLIERAFEYFETDVEVGYKLLKEDGTEVEFSIKQLA
jgi:hypothetical protein